MNERELVSTLEQVVQDCHTCISPALPSSGFRLDPSCNIAFLEIGNFQAKINLANKRLSARTQIITQFTTLVPFVRRDQMRRSAGCSAGLLPEWLFSAHSFASHWLKETRNLSRIPALERAAVNSEAQAHSFKLDWRPQPAAKGSRFVGASYCGIIAGTIAFEAGAAVRLTDQRKPQKLLIANGAWPLAAIIKTRTMLDCHPILLVDFLRNPLISGFDGRITSVQNIGSMLEIGLEAKFGTLAPMPASALRLAPPSYDPAAPWDLTRAESARLAQLIDAQPSEASTDAK